MFGFLFAQSAQYKTGDFAAVAGVAYAKAQALEIVGAQMGDGVAQPVVAAVAAAFLEFGRAGRQVKLVVGNQNLFRGDLEEVRQGLDGSAAAVVADADGSDMCDDSCHCASLLC